MKPSFEELLNIVMESEEMVLTTADEDQAIQELTDQLCLLMSARSQMQTVGTVCRPQMQDLVDEAGLVLPEQCPINSYTSEPSQTNLTVTVESILDTAKNVIMEILAKTVEILRRILDFIRRLLDPILGYSKNYMAVRDWTVQVFDLDNELAKALADAQVVELTGPDREKYDRAKAEIDGIQKEWNENWSHLRADLLFRNRAFDTLQACGLHLQDTFNQVVWKIGLLSSLLKETHRDVNDVVVQKDITEKLDEVLKPINCKPYEVALTLLGYNTPYEDNQSLSIFSAWLHNELSRMHAAKMTELPIEEVCFKAIADRLNHEKQYGDLGKPVVIIKGNDGEIKIGASELQKTIKNFGPAIQALRGTPPPVDKRGQLGEHFRAATLSLVSEFNGASSIIGDIVRSNGEIYRSYGMMARFMSQMLNMRMIMLRANGKEEDVKAMEAKLDIVKRSLHLA